MRRRILFPPVDTATEDGLVAIGGDLETDTIRAAYKVGIFPWPVSVELPLAWFSPDPRGVIDFKNLHVSRSFEKFLRKTNFRVTFNQSFHHVILECARMKRKDQPSTWITPDLLKGYEKLFAEKGAYSVEVWDQDELVGGMYGVCLGRFVSGESMFMKKDNASKFALYSLIRHLERQGLTWMDTQMVTNVVEQFGGTYVPRSEFLKRIQNNDWDDVSKIFYA